MIKNLIKKIVLKKKNINIDMKTKIDISTINKNINSKFAVNIKNSRVLGVIVDEGCEIFDCFCYGNIELGRFVSIMGPGTGISSILSRIKIGSFSSIGQNVNIQDSYHRYDKVTTYFTARNIFNDTVDKDVYTKGDIVIGEDVWIGSNSNILSGVTIGRGSIIGAESTVTKDIPPYSIAFGNPAKVYKMRFNEEVINFLEGLEWWKWDIEKIHNNKNLFEMDLNKENLSQIKIM